MMNNSLRTLGEVRAEVNRMSETYWDEEIPVRDLKFDSLDTIRIDGEPHRLKPIAQKCIAWRLGMPHGYLQKCDCDLQSINLNRWLPEERNENLFFRFEGQDVRAIFTPRYTPCDNPEVLSRLDSCGYGDGTEVQCKLDDEFLMLNIPDRDREFRLNGKEEMQPGVSISNSEVGLASLTISAFCLRLICTNGMVSKTSVDASYRHVSVRILKEFPEVLNRTSQDLDRQRRQWEISVESPVADPEMTLKAFNPQFELGKKEQDAVDWAWPQESGDKMFHIVNTYTRSAQYPTLNAGESYHLQRTAGSILAMVR